AWILVRDGGAADDDVRLRPVARYVPTYGRLRPRRRYGQTGGVASGPCGPARSLQDLEQRVVLHVPGRGHDELRRVIRALVEPAEVRRAQRGHRVARPEDRVPVGMSAPQCLVVQLEHE